MALKNRIEACNLPSSETVSILLPVLNESERLAACLESLIAQPAEVREILVIDGGSRDGTQSIIASFAKRDSRVRLVDASPVDPQWTGKVWGLYCGLNASDPQSA